MSAAFSNFSEVDRGYSPEQAIAEAKRCLQCPAAPCRSGCPLSVGIPDFIRSIAIGDFEAAARSIRQSGCFPAICGRICAQEEQCEKRCVLGKKGAPVKIGQLERFIGDWILAHPDRLSVEGDFSSLKPARNDLGGLEKKRIAVVGSGPAGLAVAEAMLKSGCVVTIFEALHDLGGVLLYGIPDFRLSKSLVKAEIERLFRLGLEARCDCIVGKTVTVDELLTREKFDAVFIGSGAGLPALLNIPGEQGVGVYTANEYLTRVNLMKAASSDATTPVLQGDTVVTIGGGNVAMDAVRTAVRLGAMRSVLVYRRGEGDIPARRAEIEHARGEGVEFQFFSYPTEIILDDQYRVTGLRVGEMQYDPNDSSSKRAVKPVPGSERVIPCSVVIVAIGNHPNALIQQTTPGLDASSRATIVVDEHGRTSKKGVYAGGDVVTGAATAVLAMKAGRLAATAMKADLSVLTDQVGAHG